MSTKDNVLIEKMARAICLAGGRDPDLEDNNVADGVFLPNWTMFNSGAKDALAVARKAILEEAANVAEGVFSGTSKLGTPQKNELFGGGEFWHSGSMYDEARIDAAEAIRSLSTQEKNND